MKLNETHSATGDAPVTAPPAPEARNESPKQETGAGKTRDRRARSTGPASRGKTPAKRSNGHVDVNGHDRVSRPSAVPAAPEGQGNAASVDANGASAASAAISAAAGTDRDAYAEVAQASDDGKRPRAIGAHSRLDAGEPQHREASDKPGRRRNAKPGTKEIAPLPDSVADFVDEIHSRVNLFRVLQRLLRSEDEKVKQRALERILEMKYAKDAASVEEPVQIILDGPRPQRD
jgi:hypothetical protein